MDYLPSSPWWKLGSVNVNFQELLVKNKVFGTIVAGAVAGLLSGGVAVAKDKKAKAEPKAGEGWCKSNACAGKVAGAKNECKGHAACQGLTKEKCEEGGNGTWSTEAKPAK